MRLARSPYVWIAAVYIATWLAMPAGGVWINDNGVKLLQAERLQLSSFSDYSLGWSGVEIDPDFRFQPLPPPLGIVKDGRLFASYPPAFAMLLAVLTGWFGRDVALLLPVAGALLSLPAVRRLADAIAGEADGASGRLALLLTALATPLWFYAFTVWEHTLSLALVLWCLVGLSRLIVAPSLAAAVWVGGFAAAAAWLRTDGYLFAAIVVVVCFALRGLPLRLRFAVPGSLAAGLLPLWLFQYRLLGHPLGLHLQSQRWDEMTLSGYLLSRGAVASNLLLNCHPSIWLSAALAGAFWCFLLWRPRLEGARARAIVVGAGGLALVMAVVVATALLNHPRPMYGLIRLNGLFAAAPLALFAFMRLPERSGSEPARLRRILAWILWSQVALFAALAPDINSTGLHWGCRFLLVAYPLLTVLAAPVLVHAWRLRGRGVVTAIVLAIAASVILQWFGVGLLAARKGHNAELNRRVTALEPQAIVTDVWFLPPTLTESFHRVPVFLVHGPRGVREVASRLNRTGISSMLLISGEAGAPPGTVDGPDTLDGPMAVARLRMRVLPTAGR